jgi:hypothetical protein
MSNYQFACNGGDLFCVSQQCSRIGENVPVDTLKNVRTSNQKGRINTARGDTFNISVKIPLSRRDFRIHAPTSYR